MRIDVTAGEVIFQHFNVDVAWVVALHFMEPLDAFVNAVQ